MTTNQSWEERYEQFARDWLKDRFSYETIELPLKDFIRSEREAAKREKDEEWREKIEKLTKYNIREAFDSKVNLFVKLDDLLT